jgi:hypothetical protein
MIGLQAVSHLTEFTVSPKRRLRAERGLQIARACTSSSIASAAVGDLFVRPVTALTRFFRSEQTEEAHAGRCYSHPRSPNAERSTPGGAYHPPER